MLLDPFALQPMKLGWGCAVPTSIVTLRYTNVFSIPASSSSSWFATPNAKALLQTPVTGSFYLRNQYPDGSSALANYIGSQSRLIAGGMQVRTLQSGTQVLPRIYGAWFADSMTSLNTTITSGPGWGSTISTGSTARILDPLTATLIPFLPLDPESFIFSENYLGGQTTNNSSTDNIANALGVDYFSCSLPFVSVFNNDPAALSVAIDVIAHMEVLPNTAYSGGGVAPLISGDVEIAPQGVNSELLIATAASIVPIAAAGVPATLALTAGANLLANLQGQMSNYSGRALPSPFHRSRL